MRINLFFLAFVTFLFTACDTTDDAEGDNKTTAVVREEFVGIEELFTEKEFASDEEIKLLKEINICSDVQADENGTILTPCTPENFKMFPLKEGKSLSDGFVLLIKANTGGFALRRILVFERENGALVKVNGYIANLIGKKKKEGSNDDLLLRFIDKIDGSDVFYNCIFSWEDERYVFKTVELIQEPAGNFSGIVRADVKDSVSKEILTILNENKMIF